MFGFGSWFHLDWMPEHIGISDDDISVSANVSDHSHAILVG